MVILRFVNEFSQPLTRLLIVVFWLFAAFNIVLIIAGILDNTENARFAGFLGYGYFYFVIWVMIPVMILSLLRFMCISKGLYSPNLEVSKKWRQSAGFALLSSVVLAASIFLHYLLS